MSVKIGPNTKIGDNNAIGENAQVQLKDVNQNNGNNMKKQNGEEPKEKMWFVRHPWLSAIACSLIASLIFWFLT